MSFYSFNCPVCLKDFHVTADSEEQAHEIFDSWHVCKCRSKKVKKRTKEHLGEVLERGEESRLMSVECTNNPEDDWDFDRGKK